MPLGAKASVSTASAAAAAQTPKEIFNTPTKWGVFIQELRVRLADRMYVQYQDREGEQKVERIDEPNPQKISHYLYAKDTQWSRSLQNLQRLALYVLETDHPQLTLDDFVALLVGFPLEQQRLIAAALCAVLSNEQMLRIIDKLFVHPSQQDWFTNMESESLFSVFINNFLAAHYREGNGSTANGSLVSTEVLQRLMARFAGDTAPKPNMRCWLEDTLPDYLSSQYSTESSGRVVSQAKTPLDQRKDATVAPVLLCRPSHALLKLLSLRIAPGIRVNDESPETIIGPGRQLFAETIIRPCQQLLADTVAFVQPKLLDSSDVPTLLHRLIEARKTGLIARELSRVNAYRKAGYHIPGVTDLDLNALGTDGKNLLTKIIEAGLAMELREQLMSLGVDASQLPDPEQQAAAESAVATAAAPEPGVIIGGARARSAGSAAAPPPIASLVQSGPLASTTPGANGDNDVDRLGAAPPPPGA